MATFPTFDGYYRPELHRNLKRDVDKLESQVNQVQDSTDADEAERLLDKVCNQCVDQFKTQMEEIKVSVKSKSAMCTNSEDREKYTLFVKEVANGIRSTQAFFDRIFERIRHIVQTVVNWIRNGLNWITNIVTDTFKTIQEFFH